MSSTVIRVQRLMAWLLGVEGILLAAIIGISLHR